MEGQVDFSQEVRELLFARCHGYCEKCSYSLQKDNWCAHHRLLRKHGGKGTVQNGLAVHHSCHNTSTDSIHLNPKKSYEMGWLVKSWDKPETARLTLSSGRCVRLTDDGNYE